MGTQKNCLNETVLLSSQNTYLDLWISKKNHNLTRNISLSVPMPNICIYGALIAISENPKIVVTELGTSELGTY